MNTKKFTFQASANLATDTHTGEGPTPTIAAMAAPTTATVRILADRIQVLGARLLAWWREESVTFTRLCATDAGEAFTHGDVVKAHLYCVIVLTLIILGGNV